MDHDTQRDTLRAHGGRGRIVPVPAAPRGVVPQMAAAALGTAVPGRFGNYAVQLGSPSGPGIRTLFKHYRPGAGWAPVNVMLPMITLGPNYAYLHNIPTTGQPRYREYLAMLNYALGFHAIGWLEMRRALTARVPVICVDDVIAPDLDRPRVLRAFSCALLLRTRLTQYVGADLAGGLMLRPGECRYSVYAEAVPPGNRFIACRNEVRFSPMTYRTHGPVEPSDGPVADAGILAGLNPDPAAPVPHDSDGEPAGESDGEEYFGDVRECISCGYEYDHDEYSECPDCGYEP